ncbi:MAG: PDZ domain-containing protein [Balneolaceae bacterium]|nr:PDZ domain-containing protein [Balneolaceae bacterium]
MSTLKLKNYSLLLVLIIPFLTLSCKKSSTGPDNEQGPYFNVNQWMNVNMDFYYFWNDEVPEEVDGTILPQTYFNSMLNSEDEFSFMSDDAEALLNDLQGSSFSAGFSAAFGAFSGTDDIFIIVEYVYPGTPADEAGFKRGDIILAINGQRLNRDNYVDLYYQESDATYLLGAYDAESDAISETDSTVMVSKSQLVLNPVVHTSVIEKGNSKIGYMFYAKFLNGANDSFIEVVDQTLEDFQSQGVNELIIDLRYNGGGTIASAVNIANSIAPVSTTANEDIFVKYQYNSALHNKLLEEEGADSPNLVLRFSEDPVNLGLDRVFFLTTSGSASASELLINGLAPYMDVVTVGTPTFGKFYGSFVLTGQSVTPSHSYAIVPVVLKYANANGVTDFRDGLAPDYEVQEDIVQAVALGDTTDPMIGKVLEIVTGDQTAKTVRRTLPYRLLDDPVELKKGNIFKVKKPRSKPSKF